MLSPSLITMNCVDLIYLQYAEKLNETHIKNDPHHCGPRYVSSLNPRIMVKIGERKINPIPNPIP